MFSQLLTFLLSRPENLGNGCKNSCLCLFDRDLYHFFGQVCLLICLRKLFIEKWLVLFLLNWFFVVRDTFLLFSRKCKRRSLGRFASRLLCRRPLSSWLQIISLLITIHKYVNDSFWFDYFGVRLSKILFLVQIFIWKMIFTEPRLCLFWSSCMKM